MQKSKDEHGATIVITPMPGENKFALYWEFNTFWHKEKDGRFSCCIPSFDIYFTANDMEQIDRKSKAMTHMLFDHFFFHTTHSKQDSLKALVLELRKLGFKSRNNDSVVVKKLINGEVVPARLKATIIELPDQFTGINKTTSKSELAVAC